METRSLGKKRNKSKPSSSSLKESDMLDSEAGEVFGDETTGYILSHTPPIVERILEHLPIPILNKCACVCKLWNSVVQAIKRRRKDVFWMFKVQAARQDEHVNPNDPTHSVFATKKAQEVGTHFHETLKTAFSQPKLGIVFCVEQITEKPKKYFRDYTCCTCNTNGKKDQKTRKSANSMQNCPGHMAYHEPLIYHEPFVEYLSRHLPQECSITSCATTGIVGTPVDFSCPIELEQSVGFTSVFFPSIPGLETYHFSITDDDADAFFELDVEKLSPSSIDEDAVTRITGIPKDKDVKCLLIFLDDLPQPQDLTCFVLEHYMNKQNFKIALGGAIVDQVISPIKKDDKSKQIAVGIAFVGETVKAASVVLEPSIRKPQQVLEKLNELKACNFPEKNCVAFMFACCGRGTAFYKKGNVEAETFRKVFPTVPLFGLFGNGEIGNNYFPNTTCTGIAEVKKSFSYRDSSRPHWFHGYTTIFILLSWGKK